MQKRREMTEYSRFNYRNWPIRRQLMISFLCTTIFLQLIIIIVIFVNLTKMKNDTNEAVHSKVYDRTSVEFQNIAYEVGHSFQAHQFHLASQLMAFREMFNLFSSIDSPYTGTPFLDCLAVTTRADYSRVCFYIPKSSTVSNIAGFDQPTKDLLTSLLSCNDLLPTFMTPFLRKQILRLTLTIELPLNQISVMLIYPAQSFNDSYEPKGQDWYYQSSLRTGSIVLNGPVQDLVTLKIDPGELLPTIMSLSLQERLNKTVMGSQLNYTLSFQLQYTCESLRQLFSELNYLTTAEVVVTNINQTIIYAPSYWSADQYRKLTNISAYPWYSGFNTSTVITKMSMQEIDRSFNADPEQQTAQMVQLPLLGVYKDLDLGKFLVRGLNISEIVAGPDSMAVLYLYCMQSEMLHIYDVISTIISHEETVIILLTMCSCMNTVAIVFIFTYMVAVKISRPLRKLIVTAAQMSQSATQKNVTQKILQELDQIEAKNQIADLIEAFKNLVRTIDQRNNTQKSTAKSQVIQYPLNQYDPEFINKTKGESDINWRNVIDEIEDGN